MTTTSYIPEIECDITVSNGVYESQVVAVPDEDNKKHSIRIPKGSLTRRRGKTYLPIAVIRLDDENERALIELPEEAGSGYRRIWVPYSRFFPADESEA